MNERRAKDLVEGRALASSDEEMAEAQTLLGLRFVVHASRECADCGWTLPDHITGAIAIAGCPRCYAKQFGLDVIEAPKPSTYTPRPEDMEFKLIGCSTWAEAWAAAGMLGDPPPEPHQS